MATKTVVCPECGSESAPGRYTCGECGAFLAGVAVAPRAWEPAAAPADPAPHDAAASDAGPLPAPAPAPATDEAAAAASVPTWPDRPIMPTWGSAPATVPPPEPASESADWSQPEAADLLLEDGPVPDPVDAMPPPSPDVVQSVDWPALADPPPLPAPHPRVPAGAYLPPSALLIGLEAPEPGTAPAAFGAASAALPTRADEAGSRPRDWLAGFGSPEARWSAARRTIAIGSAVTVIGFLLPWASGSAGSLLSFWTQVWGLAGPAHWLVVAALAALGLVAAWASPRTASWPLGLPSIVVATFVLGLIWGTLLGAAQRPIGVLVVLVGAIVLAVGGAIHLDARHEAATPDV